VHALRQIHQALVPGGVLLDMHPVPPSTRAEVRGESLGEFDDAEFMRIVANAEAEIEGGALFMRESEVEFDYLERYDDPAQLLEDIREGWDGCRIPAELEKRILEAGVPVDIWERVVLRRFRAAPK
jgi:SAM-dependent methyltransferase